VAVGSYPARMVSTPYNLLPGERLLWEGRPVRHQLLRPADLLLIPFTVIWCGFAISGEVLVLASFGPSLFALFGLPFVLIGLYLTVGRFVVRAVVSRRTRYVVTDRRLLVLGLGVSGNRVATRYLHSLPPPVIIEAADGSGSLAFGAFPSLADTFNRYRYQIVGPWSRYPSVTFVLRHVPDVRRVGDLIADAQRGAGATAQ
jgi:hypothetical protein